MLEPHLNKEETDKGLNKGPTLLNYEYLQAHITFFFLAPYVGRRNLQPEGKVS